MEWMVEFEGLTVSLAELRSADLFHVFKDAARFEEARTQGGPHGKGLISVHFDGTWSIEIANDPRGSTNLRHPGRPTRH